MNDLIREKREKQPANHKPALARQPSYDTNRQFTGINATV